MYSLAFALYSLHHVLSQYQAYLSRHVFSGRSSRGTKIRFKVKQSFEYRLVLRLLLLCELDAWANDYARRVGTMSHRL